MSWSIFNSEKVKEINALSCVKRIRPLVPGA
jgi:hypothetical protein